ncbi:Hypothetical predicted protein, partial [Paramuricea clavata]
MTTHVNNVSKSAFFALRNVGKIRRYINQNDCEKLVHAFITSKLDSCNSILFELPAVEIDKLQRVQNAAARLVVGGKKYDHVTPILKQLHWLPIRARIDFKILLITYKALKELLDIYRPKRTLRSTSQNLLVVSKSKTKTYGERTFQVSAPKLWNSLPYYICLSSSLVIRRKLAETCSKLSEENWPKSPRAESEIALSETVKSDNKSTTHSLTVLEKKHNTVNVGRVVDCHRYSSNTRLLRLTAYVFKFVRRIKGQTVDKTLELSADRRTDRSRTDVDKGYSEQYVSRRSEQLINRTKISSSRLDQLRLFLDDKGMISCEGRIEHSSVYSELSFLLKKP